MFCNDSSRNINDVQFCETISKLENFSKFFDSVRNSKKIISHDFKKNLDEFLCTDIKEEHINLKEFYNNKKFQSYEFCINTSKEIYTTINGIYNNIEFEIRKSKIINDILEKCKAKYCAQCSIYHYNYLGSGMQIKSIFSLNEKINDQASPIEQIENKLIKIINTYEKIFKNSKPNTENKDLFKCDPCSCRICYSISCFENFYLRILRSGINKCYCGTNFNDEDLISLVKNFKKQVTIEKKFIDEEDSEFNAFIKKLVEISKEVKGDDFIIKGFAN